MNTTTRTALRLLIATPLAASALALGAFSAAHAETPGFDPNPGPVIVQPHDDEDPRPQGPGTISLPEDDEDPRPEGPGDITNPEDDDDPRPEGPGDITNPEDEPDGPDDKDGPNPGDDEPEVPGDKAGPNPGDDTPEDVPADVPADKDTKSDKTDKTVEVDAEVHVPNRIDAGAGAVEDEGHGLAWLLAGGGAIAAAGSVLARQRVAQRTR